jgi:hypothetical protein
MAVQLIGHIIPEKSFFGALNALRFVHSRNNRLIKWSLRRSKSRLKIAGSEVDPEI